MRYMLQKIPHHQQQLTAESLQALSHGQAWDMVYPTAPIPVQESQALPSGSEANPRFSTLSQPDVRGDEDKDKWLTSVPWDDSDMFPGQGRNEAGIWSHSLVFKPPLRQEKHFSMYQISHNLWPTFQPQGLTQCQMSQ